MKRLVLVINWMAAAVAFVAATPAFSYASPGLATGEPIEIPFIRIFLGLLVSLMVAAIAILVLRRLKMGQSPIPDLLKSLSADRPAPLINVLESRRMTQHGEASLISCNGVRYLIVVTAGQAIVVDRFDEAETGNQIETDDTID